MLEKLCKVEGWFILSFVARIFNSMARISPSTVTVIAVIFKEKGNVSSGSDEEGI